MLFEYANNACTKYFLSNIYNVYRRLNSNAIEAHFSFKRQ